MQGFPIARRGMTIGLLGGSFDPAHSGHVHLTLEAMKHMGLDRVWWLVSPGNPLKAQGPAPMARRIAHARSVMRDPRVVITDIEARLGTRYTAATLKRLRALYPGVRFVWLMGADNLQQFHRWDSWPWIFEHVPIGVIARPGTGLQARRAKAARRYAGTEVDAHLLARRKAPAWAYLNVAKDGQSSSAIRARGEWKR